MNAVAGEELLGDEADDRAVGEQRGGVVQRLLVIDGQADRDDHARSQRREDHWFDYSRYIVVELACFLPDEQHIDPVVDADGEDEAKREHVEQVERDIEQLHRGDHAADGHREGDDLD